MNHAYYDAMKVADATLDTELGRIRAEHDAGDTSALEACVARMDAYEGHLELCRRLRRDLLGES